MTDRRGPFSMICYCGEPWPCRRIRWWNFWRHEAVLCLDFDHVFEFLKHGGDITKVRIIRTRREAIDG